MKKGTLKATKHNKYENIAGSVLKACTFGVIQMQITAHAA
jgi:hypothetical protein